jgi:ABC-type transport system involved in multi-copper enzyme maturation permease subunit
LSALLAQSLTAWRSGFRGRGAKLIVFLGLLSAAIAWLAAEFSGRQPETVALDVGFSLIRLFGALLVLFWVTELIGKDLERRTIFFVLAYPFSRSVYIASRFLAVAGLAAAAVLGLALFSLATWWLVAHSGYVQSSPVNLQGTVLPATLALIWLDLAAIGAFSLLIAALSTTPMLAFFVGLAFVVSARSLGPILAYLSTSDPAAKKLAVVYEPLLNAVHWVIPDLSRLDIRSAALYGTWPDMDATLWASLHVALYCAIALALAMLFFQRRELN